MSAKFSTTDLLHSIRQIPQSLISYIEKHVLTVLLSCMNADNQTWHSMEFIASFACMSVRSIKRYIKKLESKKFITITRPDIYTHKMTNNYSLNLDFILSFHHKSGDSQSPNMNIGCLTDTQSGDSQSPVRVTNRHTKKETKKDIKKGESKRPLPDDFEPDDQSREVGQNLGLEQTIIDVFKDYCKAKAITSFDWQATFRKFLRDEDAYRNRQKQDGKQVPAEIRSTVREFEPITVEGSYTPEVATRALGDILGKLGIAKGAKPNGHGRNLEKGKIPED